MAKNKCSKCHIRIKLPPSFPPNPFDHWCYLCQATAPLVEKTRKCSRGEKRKLLEKQQREAEKKAKQRAESLEQQELKRVAAAKSKPTYVPKSKSKKGSDLPFALNLEFIEMVEEPAVVAVDYDVLRRRIAEVQDPTIFEEELSDD